MWVPRLKGSEVIAPGLEDFMFPKMPDYCNLINTRLAENL
jgi:hypothetical protein